MGLTSERVSRAGAPAGLPICAELPQPLRPTSPPPPTVVPGFQPPGPVWPRPPAAARGRGSPSLSGSRSAAEHIRAARERRVRRRRRRRGQGPRGPGDSGGRGSGPPAACRLAPDLRRRRRQRLRRRRAASSGTARGRFARCALDSTRPISPRRRSRFARQRRAVCHRRAHEWRGAARCGASRRRGGRAGGRRLRAPGESPGPPSCAR